MDIRTSSRITSCHIRSYQLTSGRLRSPATIRVHLLYLFARASVATREVPAGLPITTVTIPWKLEATCLPRRLLGLLAYEADTGPHVPGRLRVMQHWSRNCTGSHATSPLTSGSTHEPRVWPCVCVGYDENIEVAQNWSERMYCEPCFGRTKVQLLQQA